MDISEEKIIFEGMTSVSAVINSIKSGNARRELHTVYFDSSKLRREHRRLTFLKASAEQLGFDIKLVASEEISALSNGKTHGGILAHVSQARFREISDPDISDTGFSAIIEGVEDPYSLGYSLRALYACGCSSVILPRHLPAGSDAVLCRASAGTSELLDIFLGDTADAALRFKAHGYRIACAAIPESVACCDAELHYPLLLVIGGEKRGISSKLLAMKDISVRIPYGRAFMGSLSTSSAVSILAYEILHQNTER